VLKQRDESGRRSVQRLSTTTLPALPQPDPTAIAAKLDAHIYGGLGDRYHSFEYLTKAAEEQDNDILLQLDSGRTSYSMPVKPGETGISTYHQHVDESIIRRAVLQRNAYDIVCGLAQQHVRHAHE
jgi:hypothetical protein